MFCGVQTHQGWSSLRHRRIFYKSTVSNIVVLQDIVMLIFFIQYHALQIKCIVISFIIIIIIIIIVQIFPLLLSNFILHDITRDVKITGCPKQYKHL